MLKISRMNTTGCHGLARLAIESSTQLISFLKSNNIKLRLLKTLRDKEEMGEVRMSYHT
jgi:hypothetical protein